MSGEVIVICGRGSGRGMRQLAKMAEMLKVDQESKVFVAPLEADMKEIQRKMSEQVEQMRDKALREALGIEGDQKMKEFPDFLREVMGMAMPDPEPLKELAEEMERLSHLGPSPTEIKRRLKYAKNPMEIKQLNRQLAKAYKNYKKGGA